MEDLLLLEPREQLDQFIVGIGTGFGGNIAIVYNKDGLLEFWKNEYMADSEDLDEDNAYMMAVEWFEYNTIGAYMGEHTPIYVSKDELDIFMENYEVISEQQKSILDTIESMSNSEIDLLREAFDLAQGADINLTEDSWSRSLEGFLATHREDQYLKSAKRWLDLRSAHPSVFRVGDQPPLPNMDSSFEHLPEKDVLGWREGLTFKEKADLLDSQFKRDFARVIENAITQKSPHVSKTNNPPKDLPSK